MLLNLGQFENQTVCSVPASLSPAFRSYTNTKEPFQNKESIIIPPFTKQLKLWKILKKNVKNCLLDKYVLVTNNFSFSHIFYSIKDSFHTVHHIKLLSASALVLE